MPLAGITRWASRRFAIESFVKPDSELAQAYNVLSQLAPLILENQGKETITGVMVDSNNPTQQLRSAIINSI